MSQCVFRPQRRHGCPQRAVCFHRRLRYASDRRRLCRVASVPDSAAKLESQTLFELLPDRPAQTWAGQVTGVSIGPFHHEPLELRCEKSQGRRQHLSRPTPVLAFCPQAEELRMKRLGRRWRDSSTRLAWCAQRRNASGLTPARARLTGCQCSRCKSCRFSPSQSAHPDPRNVSDTVSTVPDHAVTLGTKPSAIQIESKGFR